MMGSQAHCLRVRMKGRGAGLTPKNPASPSTFVEEAAVKAGEPTQERIAVCLLLIPPELYLFLNEEAVSQEGKSSSSVFQGETPVRPKVY